MNEAEREIAFLRAVGPLTNWIEERAKELYYDAMRRQSLQKWEEIGESQREFWRDRAVGLR